MITIFSNFKSWWYIIVSALLYVISLLAPFKCGLFILFSYAFLFYMLYENIINIYHGILWSLIVWSMQAWPLYVPLVITTQSKILAFVLIFLLVIYSGIYSVGWLWASIYYRYSSTMFSAFAWLIIALIYIELINSYFLWIFDIAEGCNYLHPLVPLMVYSSIRYLVVLLGKFFVTIIMLSTALLLATLYFKSAYKLLVVIVIGLVVCVSIKIEPDSVVFSKDCLYHDICLASPLFDPHKEQLLWDKAHEIGALIEKIKQENSKVRLICLPESSFPFDLSKHPEIIEYWSVCYLKDTGLIIGTHRQKKDYINCNSCLAILPMSLEENNDNNNEFNLIWCDKQHGVMLVERVPRLFCCFSLGNCAYRKKILSDKIICGDQSGHDNRVNFADNVKQYADNKVYPLICSELFFNAYTKIYNNCNSKPQCFLALINDAWFENTFLPTILYLSAVLTSCSNHYKIIYCSYHYKSFINIE